MTDDKELIARLRDFDKVTIGEARVAADRIEALRQIVDEMHVLVPALRGKISDTEAKLTKAEEALRDLTKAFTEKVDVVASRAKALEAKLATCEKYRDAYAECDRIGTQAVRDLEDKLALMVFERDEVIKFERDEAWKRAAHSEKMWGEAEVKLAENEVRLRKAVEALEWFRSPAFIQGPSPIDCLQTGIYKANATLAAIGETPHD